MASMAFFQSARTAVTAFIIRRCVDILPDRPGCCYPAWVSGSWYGFALERSWRGFITLTAERWRVVPARNLAFHGAAPDASSGAGREGPIVLAISLPADDGAAAGWEVEQVHRLHFLQVVITDFWNLSPLRVLRFRSRLRRQSSRVFQMLMRRLKTRIFARRLQGSILAVDRQPLFLARNFRFLS